jgi:uncharacterized protein YuzB (UPF0349 family)
VCLCQDFYSDLCVHKKFLSINGDYVESDMDFDILLTVYHYVSQ